MPPVSPWHWALGLLIGMDREKNKDPNSPSRRGGGCAFALRLAPSIVGMLATLWGGWLLSCNR